MTEPVVLWVPQRPPWNNTLGKRTMAQQRAEARTKGEWKHLVAGIARRHLDAPLPGPVYVELRQHWVAERETVYDKNGRQVTRDVRFPDVDSCSRAAKWVLDGLTLGGVWPDDNRLWVRAVRFEDHVVDGRNGLSITLVPVPVLPADGS